ncbi:MAG: hypothetical protein IJD89_01350, partial [Clostridia bacterium]|nr:hypothetical protein [Clostridia bacterium]
MKNKLSFFIILALLISLVIVLASCGGKTPQNSDTGTNIDTGTNTDTEKVELEEYTVTFVQEGFANVVKTVKKGESLTDIPAPQSEEGYIVEWEKVNLESITDNKIVNAIKTPIKHTVIFSQGDGHPDLEFTVNYGEGISKLPIPKEVAGYEVKWEEVDLTFITSDMEIGVVKTPIEYRITYVLNGGFNNNNNPHSYTVE